MDGLMDGWVDRQTDIYRYIERRRDRQVGI